MAYGADRTGIFAEYTMLIMNASVVHRPALKSIRTNRPGGRWGGLTSGFAFTCGQINAAPLTGTNPTFSFLRAPTPVNIDAALLSAFEKIIKVVGLPPILTASAVPY